MADMVSAVLFDFSGTLFRLEEQDSWFAGMAVDEREVDGHVQAELMRRLTAPTGRSVSMTDEQYRAWANRDLAPHLKVVPDAPHEVWLVLDGTTGQNALEQAKKFREMVNVTGIIVTKLDGTAKGGMIFSIFNELKLPVHYVGLGEGVTNLVFFDPDNFVNSLFDEN